MRRRSTLSDFTPLECYVDGRLTLPGYDKSMQVREPTTFHAKED
jgi:hypothetical protein